MACECGPKSHTGCPVLPRQLYVHASEHWPHIHHSEATRLPVCTLCLVPPVDQKSGTDLS
ncbi:hypothetical protein EYF80_049498 [Liparis tanakae]|uniref:Uncharacterized protein n=1 Tax=Liparis tanakae TaxID=230148 RepID=A0A4Z2FGK0_9TELE|nr:hypothetical protein EYF80_049498 [Liparis tanakae]